MLYSIGENDIVKQVIFKLGNMKATNYVLPFAFGLAGGLIAFVGGNLLVDRNEVPVVQHDIVGPGVSRPVVQTTNPAQPLAAGGSVDLREAAKKTVPAVVNVTPVQMGRVYYGSPLDFWFGGRNGRIREEPLDMGIGSGVIITKDGYIITNNHVVAQSDKVMVTLNDKRKFEAKLIGTDPDTDIALLKIDATGLQPIEYGNSDDVVLGEWVLAVGNPYNLTSTVTAGIISAKARGLGNKMNLESFLQTDAAVNPGNSGGALVNAKGELIGINTAIQSPTGSYSGYSFAVPVNVARKVVSDLKEFGKVQRAVLGVSMRELTPELAKKIGLKETSGIYVAEVISGGAASKAGLKSGDVIIQINGYDVVTAPQLQEQLAKYAPGDIVKVSFSRDGKMREVDITLQNVFGDVTVSTESGILGAQVESLTKDEQYRYRLTKGVKIVMLKNGKFKEAGLTEGYIIVKINNTVVYNAEDLERAIKSAGDEGVFVTAVSPRGRVEYFAFSLLN